MPTASTLWPWPLRQLPPATRHPATGWREPAGRCRAAAEASTRFAGTQIQFAIRDDLADWAGNRHSRPLCVAMFRPFAGGGDGVDDCGLVCVSTAVAAGKVGDADAPGAPRAVENTNIVGHCDHL